MNETNKIPDKPNAVKWLSEGLQEINAQLVRGDIGGIARLVGKSEPSVRPYFKGEIADINTGSEILKTAKNLVIAREKEIKKLVA